MKHLLGGVLVLLIISTVKAEFVDIDVTHPNFHAISELERLNIINGYPVADLTFFKPLNEINRAEALKLLMLGANIELLENDPQSFSDVPFAAWYSPYVNTAANRKIVKGFLDGKFHPDSKVTKAEFIKMLNESFAFPENIKAANQEWYHPYFAKAQELNIHNDFANPTQTINRGQAAEMIFRAIKVQANNNKAYRYSGTGSASYYNEGFAGNPTATGEIYDPFDLTAAHRTLPFGTRLKVTHEGKSVVVRINDRGPYHKQRIIDLSQRAFESLAPISRGVLMVDYEVVVDEARDLVEIPETVEALLSEEVTTPEVPKVVQELMEADTPASQNPGRFAPLFRGTINTLSKDFFPHVTLRKTMPKVVATGSIMRISGTSKEPGHTKAKVFLKNIENNEQYLFEGPVSGLNFSIPVAFYKAGKYHMGIVFGEDRKSIVTDIEVRAPLANRNLPAKTIEAATSIKTEIDPANQEIWFEWAMPDRHVAKLEIAQGPNLVKTYYFEDGISRFALPFSEFESFRNQLQTGIDLFLAPSEESNLIKQTAAFQKTAYSNYIMVEGFEDYETNKVTINNFERYPNTQTVTLKGVVTEPNTELRETAYLTKPNGYVTEIPLQFTSQNQFMARLDTGAQGAYVFELVSAQGEVLFNKGLYHFEDLVLPIKPWPIETVFSETRTGVFDWTNLVRTNHKRKNLTANAALDAFAQTYAERMANENFLGHVDPEGRGFGTRMKEAGFNMTAGENVAFGSTLQLALDGLASSGSHRKNILSTTWNTVGIGAQQKSDNEWYVVQVFAKDQSE